MRDGYELTSVDAIAASAEVSKRTVYDHFGDKEGIYSAVVEVVLEKLLTTVSAALEQELPPHCDLRTGLLAFARRVATEAFPSSEYVAFRQLTSRGSAGRQLTHSARNGPRELFTRRMELFVAEGAVRTDHPQRAADHFIALTFRLALDTLDAPVAGSSDDVDGILVDGVDAFIRAYT